LNHIRLYFKKLHDYSGNILYVNMIGMLLISMLEGVGIILLIPMINISGVVTLDSAAFFGIPGVQFLKNIPGVAALLLILGIYVLIVISHTLLMRSFTIRNVKILHGFAQRIRRETYEALLKSNWDFFVKKRRSDLLNVLTVEVPRAVGGINFFLQLLSSSLFTLIQIGIAFWLSAKMTALVLLCGAVLTLFSRTFIKRAQLLGQRTTEIGQSYLAGVSDDLNGIKDVKSNTLEESRLKWFHYITQQMLQEQIEYVRLRMGSEVLYKITSSLLIASFVFLFIHFFNTQQAELLLIVLIFSRLWPRFTGMQNNLQQLSSTLPALKILSDLQDECRIARETENEKDLVLVEPIKLQHGLECRNVYFRYLSDSNSYALQNINLHIPANRMTAIVGRSGAGKSTLVDIIMGMLQPESGQVLIDGNPLTSKNLLALRKSISYVPQDPFLFNGTIRENLLMMVPNATEEEMWNALKFAASDFVHKLPQGLDTLIGDRGVRLSGGERQRLVLARAILRNPSILVLDEATSALDTENESKIQDALERLRGKMTIIVIAHRLTTIRHADQVVVLDQGEIVQSGGFLQLANEKKGLFSNLLGNQVKVVSTP